MNVRYSLPLALCLSLTVYSCSPSKFDFQHSPNAFSLEDHIEGDLDEVDPSLPPGDPGSEQPVPPKPGESPAPEQPKPGESPAPMPPKPGESPLPVPPKPGEPDPSVPVPPKPGESPLPGKPGKPSKPSNPEQPGEDPSDGGHGNKPEQPGKPGKPDMPGKPGKPGLSDIPAEYLCGNGKKVLVCHFPPGNPANAHTICISINGAMNGHGVPMDGGVGIAGDHLGECSQD